MNNSYGDDEALLPPEKLAAMQRRVQSLNGRPLPAWGLGAIGLGLLVLLGAIGYFLYDTYSGAKPEVTVEYYEGVHIAGASAQKDAQAAIARFHASPAYAAARERGLRELQQAPGPDSPSQ